MAPEPSVNATLGFWTRRAVDLARAAGPQDVDMRRPSTGSQGVIEPMECEIHDARRASDLGLERSGFELFHAPTPVSDWFDEHEVIATYYEECRALARKITGAEHTFTYDHLIREPGKQTSGGGRGDGARVTGPERGGGYIGGVHMDYTDHSVWADYLATHGVREPVDARRVIALNFWRSLGDPVEDHPLAVCDARTVHAEDLAEFVIYGYGPESYSWHDIGISIYYVASSPGQRWYYYPRMTGDEVLVIKSYDSKGVIGRACPHASFEHPAPAPGTPPRRSIELRVLCYVGARTEI